MTPDYLAMAARDCDYLLSVGRRQGLDQASLVLERAYKEFREAAYMRQDTVELRWAAEQDRRATDKAHEALAAREAAVAARESAVVRLWIGLFAFVLAAAVLFVAALMVSH